MAWEVPGGSQGFYEVTEGKVQVDGKDQNKGEVDIIWPGGDYIVSYKGVTEAGG